MRKYNFKWTRRRFAMLVAVLLLAYLLFPLKTDDTRMEPDPVLARGKAEFLSQPPPPTSADIPNVIVIFADDLGKHDISLYDPKGVPTPNIDNLARDGVTFTDGYVTAPICGPSRCSLLTGRYPQRFGNELQFGDLYPKTRLELLLAKAILFPTHLKTVTQSVYPTTAALHAQGLRQSEITFADLARWRGMATGMIGKWHLGHAPGLTPNERGFDYQFGFYSAATTFVPEETNDIKSHTHLEVTDLFLRLMGRRGPSQITRNGEVVQEPEYLTDKFASEAEAFIERNKAKPFLLYLPLNAPHEPFQVPQKYYDRFPDEPDENKRIYHAMISAVDDAVGRVLAKLRKAGIEEKTLIFFASDNGGAVYTKATTNAPLKGGKLAHFEGGINVPFTMTWKGKLPAGRTYTHPVTTLDVFSTVAANVGAPLPADRPYDGVDLVQNVLDNTPAHEALFWRSGTSKAVRKGPWKLLLNERTQKKWLYNLDEDKSESNNLATQRPEILADLEATLRDWEKDLPPPLWPVVAHSVWKFGDEIYTFDI